MGFMHGKKARVYGGGYDLSSYLRSVNFAGDLDLAEKSTFADDDKSYLAGMKGGSMSTEGILSARAVGTDPKQIEDILQDAADAAGLLVVTHLPQGDGLGNPANDIEGYQATVEVNSPYDDVVTIADEINSSHGRERGVVLAPKAHVVAGGNLASVDNGNALSPTLNGLAAYLQVFAVVTGTLTVKVQHSNDNSVWADLVTMAAVAPAGAPSAERAETGGGVTVRRYLRALWTLTGGSADFALSAVRKA